MSVADSLGLDRVREAFARNFEEGLEVGAAVSVWVDRTEVLSLHGGWKDRARTEAWEAGTAVLIWSATKGLTSACLLHLLGAEELDAPVATVWPEFAAAGKGGITFRQILNHQAGLSALEDRSLSLLDHEGVVRAIEQQAPNWQPGACHGYAARTYGFLVDEIIRRLTGLPIGEYWQREFAGPLDLEIWMGMPEAEHGRVAQMLAPPAGAVRDGSEDRFLEALSDPASLTHRAFASPGKVTGATAMNAPAVRAAALPSLGGIATARSLAKFYAMLAGGGVWGSRRFFDPGLLELTGASHVEGLDAVLLLETAFAAGFMKDPRDAAGSKRRRHFGPSRHAFGHPGAGGCLAFADPEHRVGFAYVMNQMEPGVLPGRRALRLVDALYGASA